MPTTRSNPRPPLGLCNLGSGSGGNCTVVQYQERTVLLDAGFGPRTTERRLEQAGLSVRDIDAICLTHLDRDHFRPSWVRTLLEHNIPIHLHHWHEHDLRWIPDADRLRDAGLVRLFEGAPFEVAGFGVTTFRCQHDRQGTIAYRLHVGGLSLGYATDLGHVPQGLIEHLAGVDLLAIESNYDHHMTITSPRPSWVNRRNLSDSGHLSNEQALDAVLRITQRSPHANPRHIVLLHRSSQCNHPMRVKRVFEAHPHLARRLTLTHQRRRTRWLRLPPLKGVHRDQLCLAF